MARILILDTAVAVAGICLADGTDIVGQVQNQALKEQAGWLQPAIRKLVETAGMNFTDLDAIAVSAGPGSYTGLRVGMASAKGLCYALKKPLILMNTLKIMAISASKEIEKGLLICPMIDARRMEVFTALFDSQLVELMVSQAMVLTPESFDPWLDKEQVVFFGNGAGKYKNLLKKPGAIFRDISFKLADSAAFAAEMYARKEFSDLAYAEPFYIKAFHDTIKRNS